MPSDPNSSGSLMATSTAMPAAPPVSANFSTSSSLEIMSSANLGFVAAPATPGLVSVPAAPVPVSEPPIGHLPDLPSAGKVSQVTAGKKSCKMRPNSSLTARYAPSHSWLLCTNFFLATSVPKIGARSILMGRHPSSNTITTTKSQLISKRFV